MAANEDVAGARFLASGFCTSGGCVEAAQLPDGRVAIRDGRDGGPVLVCSVAEWREFVAGVKNGEFDFD